MATQAHVNPMLISWARNRSGLSETVLADKMKVKLEKVMDWEHGRAKPTFKQAQKLAKCTHTPFGYFFLPKPPIENFPIPDLRTVEGRELSQPSPELRDVITQVLTKQNWYKDYLISNEAEQVPYVGSLPIQTPIPKAAKAIRDAIGVPTPERGSWEEYYKALIEGAEAAGILVMRSGIVGNNTHRKLQVSEFRGFAICDPYAPVIFINSSDAPSARLFTFIHELAHIWLGSSGISNLERSDAAEEKYCNSVAGEFLVPENQILKLWSKNESLITNLTILASQFHVSKVVIAKRAFDSGIISYEAYSDFYKSELDKFKNKDGGGGNFYRSAGAKNSVKLAQAVVTEARSGRLLLRDAGRVLGITPSSIGKFASTLPL
ncbi:ImmA/IrrE family metallo-endopeptidase [Shewanella sp. P1-14-1]|uniref:ImmA/IrrE family metallo-endopeptidase n=1 Tax=Shewanella sp. P1-14-1 TaxID=1723761 RepID=UPI0006D681D5|nr:ImmA/IrrE family metallo-endopeptidase [Shewanella sp. P1-14-1]